MIFIKVHVDTNYCDGDGYRTVYFIYDDNTSFRSIETDVKDYANEFFEDHVYLAQGYDFWEGWESEEDEADYYDNCYWSFERITREEMLQVYNEDDGNDDIEIYDYRQKEKNVEWQ